MQVLITVLVNGGATTYMLRYWDLFDSAYTSGSARSPPSQRLEVLVPSGNGDEEDHNDGYSNGTKINATGSCVVSPCQAQLDSSHGLWLVRRSTASSRQSVCGRTPGHDCCSELAMGSKFSEAPLIEMYRRGNDRQYVHLAETSTNRLFFAQMLSSVRTRLVCLCRNVIESIHDFQRQGGLNKQLEHLDKVFSSYLIAPGNQDEGDSEYVRTVAEDPSEDPVVEEQ